MLSQFKSILGLIATFVVFGIVSPAHPASYRFTTLDYPGASYTIASGINNSGQIVGYFHHVPSSPASGFLYNGGNYTTLIDPSAPYGVVAAGINNAGQIVGYYYDGDGFHSFLNSGGNYTAFNDPLTNTTVPYGGVTYAHGINNLSQVVGSYETTSTPALDSNANNVSHGFLRSGSTYTTIDDPLAVFQGADEGTVATGINDAGQIVGYYPDATNNFHAFLYTPGNGGSFITLDDPDAIGGRGAGFGTVATGINNAGQIVGYYTVSLPGTLVYHGFVYSGGSYTTVDDPQATILGPDFPNGTLAYGINDAGQIVGSYFDANGQHGFLAVQQPPLQVLPATNIAASGTLGELFSPTSFNYQLTSTSGSVNYSISGIPSWLNASFTSGTATPSPVTVTFSLINLGRLRPGTYTATIAFANTSTGNGNTTRTATLTVNPDAKADCKDGGWRNFTPPQDPLRTKVNVSAISRTGATVSRTSANS